MEDKEVQDESDARLGQAFPGVIEDATHIDRVSKLLYRKNSQFADFWSETNNTWIGSAFTSQELDVTKDFTLI